jgi:hypothetical protein
MGTAGADTSGMPSAVTQGDTSAVAPGGSTAESEPDTSATATAGIEDGSVGGEASSSQGSAEPDGAGPDDEAGVDAGAASVGHVAFEPTEAIYSVALSVNTAGTLETIGVRNAFGSPVTVTDLAIAGDDAGSFILEGVPELPVTIAGGARLDVAIRFRPPANAPTSNFSAALSAAVSIDSANDITATTGLYGLAMSASNAEATLAQVVEALGISIDVGSTTLTLGTGSDPVGEELQVDRFVKLDGAAPVRLEPLARYSPLEAANYGYYTAVVPAVTLHRLGTMSRGPADNVANRTLFPPLDTGAMLVFDPGDDSFGLFAESQANIASLGSDGRLYQEDALNNDQGNVQPVHRVRVFPLRIRSGQIVAGSFLLVCEEASNSDYQDYVFAISNVAPAPD